MFYYQNHRRKFTQMTAQVFIIHVQVSLSNSMILVLFLFFDFFFSGGDSANKVVCSDCDAATCDTVRCLYQHTQTHTYKSLTKHR